MMRLLFGLLTLALCATAQLALSAPVTTWHVSPDGNDSWSGTLPAPNAHRTDGPFLTLERAREALRRLKAAGGLPGPVTVQLHQGVYALPQTLVLEPQDSGTPQCPITYRGDPGGKTVISGGRPVTGWRKGEGKLWTAELPGVKEGKWYPQQFFVDGERQIRARYPNWDPANPYEGGFLIARNSPHWNGAYDNGLTNMFPGDWAEYEIEAPAEGDYNLFARYGALNEPWGYKDISGRVSIRIDGGERVPMQHVPDTGGWNTYLWATQPQATVHLKAGKHVLRWTSDLGPGMDLDAMALCDDPNWRPVGIPPALPPAGQHLITIQNESYARLQGDRAILSSAGYRGADDLYFDPGALKEWPLSPDKVLHLWIFEDNGLCSNTLVPVKSIDEKTGHLVTAEKLQDASTVGARFFVDNVREALDAPGEWYVDKATGVLTYWPKDPNFQSKRCVASALQEIIRFAGDPTAKPATFVSYVNMENLTFEASAYGRQEQNWYHSEQAALDLRNVQHCRVRACRFVGMGCNAIACYAASTDNEFLGNEIGYPGGGGITLNSMTVNHYEGSCASVCERNVVAGNHIHHCGQIFKHGAGVYLNSASYNGIVNNYIHDTARHPIIATYACGGNVISFNELQNSNLETGDCGAIHTYQTNFHPAGGNVIENNLIGDVVGRATTVDGKFLSPHYTWGIYLDGESWKTTVRNNIVYRNTGGGVMMNSGQDNLWENNIFVDARDKQIQYSNYSKTGTGNKLFRNLFVFHNPKSQTGLEGQPGPEFLNTDYNLWWCPEAPVLLKPLQDAGREQHSLVADPLFVDPAHDDYRLRPESPAFSLGFKPIDLSQVGLRGYQGLRAWPDSLAGKR